MNIFNIVDVIIVLLILCCGVLGMKRGFFKEIVMTVGYLLLIIISLVLQSPIAEFLSLHLPFFEFGGGFQGLEVLNILLYQIVAFILVFAVLSIIFNIILYVSKVIEKLLDLTVILGIFSKILGLIVGLVDGYLLMFIFCIIVSCPIFDQNIVAGSKLTDTILNSTPVLSAVAKKTTKTIIEVTDLASSDTLNNKDEFNTKAVDIMLKHELITPEYVEQLIKQEKLNTPGLDQIVDKYR